MRKKNFILLAILVLLGTFSVSATEAELDYSRDTYYIEISGTAEKAGKIITVEAISCSEDGENTIADIATAKWTSIDNEEDEAAKMASLAYFSQARSDKNKQFKFSFECADGGYYSVRVLDESLGTFVYSNIEKCYSLQDIKDALAEINDSESAAELMSDVVRYKDMLGIKNDAVEALDAKEQKDFAYGYVFAQKTFADVAALNAEFANAACVTAFKYGTNAEASEAILMSNKELFGIKDCAALEVFNSDKVFSDAKRMSVISELQKADDEIFYAESSFENAFTDSVVTNGCYNTAWGKVKEILGIDALFEGKDMSAYNALSDKAPVCKYINNNRYSTVDKLVEAIQIYLKPTGGTTGVGSVNKGSANKGSGGGASVNYDAITDTGTEETPGPKEEETVTKVEFSDMQGNEWANEAVSYLCEKGVLSGRESGKFEPNATVLREEFAKMIVLAFRLGQNAADPDFSDAQQEAWYAEYVGIAAKAGVMVGKGDGTFGIGENLKREDMALIICKVLGLDGNAGNAGVFADEDTISDYAKNAVLTLAEKNIISGMGDGTFAPGEFVSRAQAAKMIYEAVTKGANN